MTITATITRRIPITQLRPGALIDGHTVHKVELEADGATALCFPPGRTDGRRVRVPLGALDGEVTVSAGPGDDTAQLIRELGRLIIDGDGDVGGSEVENAILTVPLPSGWTFALHGDGDESGDDRAAMLADIDAADEDD